MLKKEMEQRQAIEMLCTDMLVPKDHLLRKIDAAVDFTYIYSLVEDLYCEDNGRPSCDPVVLFKLVLIQHLFGIRSLRQTMRDVEVNVAYRWFLGYTMSQQLPHFATISYAFRHRFTADVIEAVFRWVLEEVACAGYLSPEVVFVDGTHIKANANMKKQVKKQIPKAARHYQEQLMEEVDADRKDHGKKPLKKDNHGGTPSAKSEEKTITESTTDPDCGVFHKGEHQKCFAYEAHTVCEKRGYVLEVEVTPGNVHDSVAFDTVFERLVEHYPEVEVVTADAGYKTPWICKQVIDSGRIPSLPYKRPMTMKGNLPWYEYVYDEYYDCVLCPQYKVLEYATTNRDGYREYKSKGYICKDCPVRKQCTQNKQCVKTVTRHIWHNYLEQAEDIRHSPLGKATYDLRSQTIERVFADAKEKHAMRYTPYRGLPAVTAWVKLKFTALNLKKLAIHKWMSLLVSSIFHMIEATLLHGKVASLTGWGARETGAHFIQTYLNGLSKEFHDDMIVLICDGAAWHKAGKLMIPDILGCICRFALGFCKNIKKRTETLYQSFSPFMWNDSRNDTIQGFRCAIGLSFNIGCIWVQKSVLGCESGSEGATPGFHFTVRFHEHPTDYSD